MREIKCENCFSRNDCDNAYNAEPNEKDCGKDYGFVLDHENTELQEVSHE